MGLHSPIERHFITNEGAVKTTGGSLKLAKGQVAIVDLDAPNTRQGKKLVDSFVGKSPTSKFEITLGKADIGVTRSLSNKSLSSVPFTLEDVKEVRVSAPDGKGDQVDDFVIGFNGVDGTEIDMNNGDTEIIQVELTGKGIQYLGYSGGKAVVQVVLIAPDEGTKILTGNPVAGEWTMEQVVTEGIERLINSELLGQTPITDLVDIIPVKSTNPATIPGTPQNFYSLTIGCDRGTYNELAKVQAQYPTLDIKNEVLPTGGTKYITIGTAAPSDYSTSLPDILKGCDTCPTGYTELNDGYVYSIEIEDDGVDLSATLELAVPNAEVGSTVRNGGEAGTGSGFYSVVTTQALTQAEIDAFILATPTAVLVLVSTDVAELCTNATTVETAWVQEETCSADVETYTIRLADDECGNTILPELQAAYSDLTIVEEVAPAPAGCSRTYSTTVATNLVCEECSPIYRELFDSEAPEDYDQIAWKKADPIYDGAAKMGIRVRGKKTRLGADESVRDEIPFIADSVRIKLVGGFPSEINENYSIGENGRFNVTLLSRYTPPTHLGGQLYVYEDMSRTYFDSTTRHKGDNYAKFVFGEESLLKPFAQYVDYAITIHKRRYAQTAGQKQDEGLTYHIFAEVGRHQAVEDLVNSLAAAAGVPTVQAFAKA